MLVISAVKVFLKFCVLGPWSAVLERCSPGSRWPCMRKNVSWQILMPSPSQTALLSPPPPVSVGSCLFVFSSPVLFGCCSQKLNLFPLALVVMKACLEPAVDTGSSCLADQQSTTVLDTRCGENTLYFYLKRTYLCM